MVEERLLALDWLSPSGPKLTLAGCSLGAAVAIHLAVAHPERIARLNLLAPAGLPEPWYMPAHSVRVAFRILCAALPPSTHLDRLRHVLHVTLTTPDYKCDVEQLVRLAAGGAFDVAVYGAGLDLVHSPHAHFWKSAEAGGGVRYTHLSGWTHWGVCSGLYSLRLHEIEALWHEVDGTQRGTPMPPSPPELRSRL